MVFHKKKKPKSAFRKKYESNKKRIKRENRITYAKIKLGKLPPPLNWFVILPLFFLFTLFFINPMINFEENIRSQIILVLQTIILFFQVVLLFRQNTLMSLSHLPELIPISRKYKNSPNKIEIRIKNIGSTAHKVELSIKSKRKEKINTINLNHDLYTIEAGGGKEGAILLKEEFVNKEFRLDLEYCDKLGGLRFAYYIKLKNEHGFIPL